MSCSTIMISMLSYLLFIQSELLLPKAHNLLLVAIAFSSTILLNPNPHIDLLCTLVINYPQVKRLKMSWTRAGQGHFTESHLINIFIFVWPKLLYSQCMRLGLSAYPRNLANSTGLLLHLLSACWWLMLCNHILQQQKTKSVGGWMHLMQSLLLSLQPEVQTYASGTPVRTALICWLIKHAPPKNAP